MPRAKLKLHQRAEALYLLSHGYTIGETSEALQELRHPRKTVAQVRKLYFPSRGPFAISRFEGKSFKQIANTYGIFADRYRRFGENVVKATEKHRKQLKQRKQHAAATKRLLDAVKRLRETSPEYRRLKSETSRKTMKRLWAKPEFREKMASMWDTLRARTAKEALELPPKAWEGTGTQPSRRVLVHVPDIEVTLDHTRALFKMLSQLQPLQRYLVSNRVGIEMQHRPEVIAEAAQLTPEGRERVRSCF